MEKQKKTVGVVLAEAAYGETGKRLTLFTKELGKVTAFANGAKKAKSPLLAGTQLFVFGNFELYQGKNAYTLTGVEVIENFYPLRANLWLTAYAMYLSELTLAFLQDGITGRRLLKLLYISFEELVKGEIKPEQIRAVFELKFLSLAGYTPELSCCIRCGSRQDLNYFTSSEGGMLCRVCAGKFEERLAPAIYQAMNYVLDMPVEKIYRFRLNAEYENQFFTVMKRYTAHYLDYPLKSEQFLKEMEESEKM